MEREMLLNRALSAGRSSHKKRNANSWKNEEGQNASKKKQKKQNNNSNNNNNNKSNKNSNKNKKKTSGGKSGYTGQPPAIKATIQIINTTPGKTAVKPPPSPVKINSVSGYNKSKSLYGGNIKVASPNAALSTPLTKKQRKKMKRANRKMANLRGIAASSLPASIHYDVKADPVVGHCQNLEKEYYRLTSEPNPAEVRPLRVLKKSLAMVKQAWANNGSYEYCCTQMKSIRQDLTVQHIKNNFVVEVYETHARIALEDGDYEEFGQCQTQLFLLYGQGFTGHRSEFQSYRVLHSLLFMNMGKGKVDSSMITFMSSLLSEYRTTKMTGRKGKRNGHGNEKENQMSGNHNNSNSKDAESNEKENNQSNIVSVRDPSVEHALAVRTAVLTNNYCRFFQLYSKAPNMSCYLMDPLCENMRDQALKAICSAYRPTIPLKSVTDMLALENVDHLTERNFVIKSVELQLSDGSRVTQKVVDTKASLMAFNAYLRANKEDDSGESWACASPSSSPSSSSSSSNFSGFSGQPGSLFALSSKSPLTAGVMKSIGIDPLDLTSMPPRSKKKVGKHIQNVRSLQNAEIQYKQLKKQLANKGVGKSVSKIMKKQLKSLKKNKQKLSETVKLSKKNMKSLKKNNNKGKNKNKRKR